MSGGQEQVRRLARRDGWNCHYCGRSLGFYGQPAPTIDHVRAKSRGGDNGDDNCVLACQLCNYRKADT